MSLKKDVISGVKWSSISTIFLAVAGLLKIAILARLLEKSDFGLMALVTFVLGFMTLFNDMGLTSAILYKQGTTKQEYASLYWLNLMVSGGMYFILLLITPFVSLFYEEPKLNTLIPLLGLNLIISGIGMMFKTIEQKALKFKAVALFDIVSALLSLGLAVILAFYDYGVYALIYSALLQYGLMNILYLGLGLKKYGLQFHYRFKETRPFLKIGIYQVGGQVVNYFNRDLDILIIGKFFSPELLGGYSLAKQLVMRPMQVLNPIITKVAAPTLTKFQHSLKDLRRNYLKLTNLVSTVNTPIYFILIIMAPWVVHIFYGNGFEEIIILVRILAVYMLIRAVSSPVGSLVVATGRTDLEFYWNIISLLITPICIIIGSQFGLIGAALGITTSAFILFVPGWRLLIYRLIKVKFVEYVRALVFLNLKIIKGKL